LSFSAFLRMFAISSTSRRKSLVISQHSLFNWILKIKGEWNQRNIFIFSLSFLKNLKLNLWLFFKTLFYSWNHECTAVQRFLIYPLFIEIFTFYSCSSQRSQLVWFQFCQKSKEKRLQSILRIWALQYSNKSWPMLSTLYVCFVNK
jgi:hypothetical protein